MIVEEDASPSLLNTSNVTVYKIKHPLQVEIQKSSSKASPEQTIVAGGKIDAKKNPKAGDQKGGKQ